ncbi:MAG: proline--tRNA ligase [Dehalococcoidia bacterium]|nr:proline--tRNA ligase [Dehalococcoidia bacterium]
MPPKSVLTPQSVDFPQWYQDVLNKAELADNGPVRGTMVIRPYGYALWERIQAEVDARIKQAGGQNVYLPLFIPESYLRKEAEHVKGFSPELAVVTHAGGKQLEEPVVVRPTSETLFGEVMAKWVQSYRDLPLLLNQWANVVRWELRPRMFLRTTEFLWQEGHTAHATEQDAASYALRILHEVYRDFFTQVLAIPVLVGRKTKKERFAGATNTMTCEGMMRDGKALQMATSHELGQTFAKAFNINYTSESGQVQIAWTTSWGSSTRMVGALIMAQGDDNGLRVPPQLAPTQAVVLLVRDEQGAGEKARAIADALAANGVRVRLDADVASSFGRRATKWELQGIPVRIEVGPRDVAAGTVTVARRDTGVKMPVSLDGAAQAVPALLKEIQEAMLAQSSAWLASHIADAATLEEAKEAAQTGFARLPYAALGENGEAELGLQALSVRCLQREDGSVPASESEPGIVAIIGRAY